MNLEQLEAVQAVVTEAKRFHRGEWSVREGGMRTVKSKQLGLAVEAPIRLETGLYHMRTERHHEHGTRTFIEPLTLDMSFMVSLEKPHRVMWASNMGGTYYESEYLVRCLGGEFRELVAEVRERAKNCAVQFTLQGITKSERGES